MKKSISKIVALVVVMMLLPGMVSAVSAGVSYEATEAVDVANNGTFDPDVVVGTSFVVETVINVPAFGTDNHGVKFVLSNSAGGSSVEYWITAGSVRVHDSAWTAFDDHAYDFTAHENQDLKITLAVDNGAYLLYVDDVFVWSIHKDAYKLTADSKLVLTNWEAPFAMKSMTIKDLSFDGQSLYESAEAADVANNGSVDPDVVIGDRFVAEAVVNVPAFGTDNHGLKFVLSNSAGGSSVEYWITAGSIRVHDSAWTAFDDHAYDFTAHENQDMKITLVGDSGAYLLYVDDVLVWSIHKDAYKLTADSKLVLTNWEAPFALKSLSINKLQTIGGSGGAGSDYELSAPVDGPVAPGVVTGSEFTAEAVLNVTAFGEWGNLKMMAGENASGNRVWLELGSSGVIAVEEVGSNSDWVGYSDAFKISDHFGEDVAVKLEVAGKEWKVSVNGTEILSRSDDRLCPTAASMFAVDAYNTVFTVKSLKITKADDPGGEVVPPPVDPGYEGGLGDAGDATVLYELSEAVNGPVAPGVVTGSRFKADAIINISEFTNEYGNFKFNVGMNSNGASASFVISKAGCWVDVTKDGSTESLGAKYNVFNWAKKLDKDVRVTLEVDGTTWLCYINDTLVWAHGDDKMLVTEDSIFTTGSWEVSYGIKELRITELAASGDDGLSVNGNVLYESNIAASDSVIPGVMTRDKYEVAMKILFNRLKPSPDENMRGVKLVIGQTAEYSSDIELWIGVDKVRLNDGGWDNATGINTDIDVDLSALHGTVAIVKVVVDGSKINLYINGTEVAAFNEEALAPSAWSQFSMSQWDSSFTVLSMVIADGTVPEGGDDTTPPTEGGDDTTPPTEGGDDVSPDTGDGFWTLFAAMMATSALACVAVMSHKKRFF